jgi:hypothetical protein
MYAIVRNATVGITCAVLCMYSGCSCPGKYAVLISANNVTTDSLRYHSEWWYDLFLQYQMLRSQGFTDKNIYVLYGNGTDFNTAYKPYNAQAQFTKTITTMAANKSNVRSIFCDTLRKKVTGSDLLYVWWMGHGGGSGAGSCDLSMQISHTGESVSDAEFASYLDSVPLYNKRVVAVMTCHSGGMIDNLNTSGKKTVVLTSSTCTQSSYDATTTCNSEFHAEFNYTLANAFRGLDACNNPVASDADHNDTVTVAEVHQFNTATMTTSTPQMADPDALAGKTVISRSSP